MLSLVIVQLVISIFIFSRFDEHPKFGWSKIAINQILVGYIFELKKSFFLSSPAYTHKSKKKKKYKS